MNDDEKLTDPYLPLRSSVEAPIRYSNIYKFIFKNAMEWDLGRDKDVMVQIMPLLFPLVLLCIDQNADDQLESLAVQ